MARFHLVEQIGEVQSVVNPDAYATDVVTTNSVGVPIKEAQGVFFILEVGDLTAGTLDAAILYSGTGTDTDASASTTVWESTDAIWAQVTSDGENEVYILDILTGNKGLSDEAGKLFVKVEAVGANDFSIVGFPYGMSRLPSTNENTVVTL